MNHYFSSLLLAALLFSQAWQCRQSTASHTHEVESVQTTLPSKVSAEMLETAQVFLASLSEEQRTKANFALEDSQRFAWHFIPKDDRIGVSIEELDETQRAAATALLRSTLSEEGYQKVESIRGLELVLREVENRPANDRRRHPEKYFFAMFGEPTADHPWGWRFEGHHVSLTFSSVSEELVAVTPAFWGSNPAIVQSGSHKGHEVLAQEQNMGRAFVKSLDAEQLAKAVILEEAPGDVMTFVDREVKLTEFEGLPVAEMKPEQQQKFRELMELYTSSMTAEIAAGQWERIEAEGFEKLYFAWAGGLEAGDGHYYRIHGPTILVEYDNVQNENNHIHTVWRDLQYDFGGDLLKQHYENSDHH